MTSQEHVALFEFIRDQKIHNAEQRENHKNIMVEITNIKSNVQKIERGMYGDVSNGTQGLIQRQANDEMRISKLENFKSRLIWFLSGGILAVEAGWEIIKRKFDL